RERAFVKILGARVFFQFYEQLHGTLHIQDMVPYTRTFIYLILHSSYDVRKPAYDIIRRLVNNLRSTDTDISLALLTGLTSFLDHFQITNETSSNDEANQQLNLTTVSKGFEETMLCIAKAMRMQDEQFKQTLSDRALLACCSSSILLSSDEKLWLKFLYLIFDKKPNEVENYLKNNVNSLVQICTTNQRLTKLVPETK
ncbi:unnamed protein product, partial [Rotaria magnacalcarata]